jgi:hypothetical protein
MVAVVTVVLQEITEQQELLIQVVVAVVAETLTLVEQVAQELSLLLM